MPQAIPLIIAAAGTAMSMAANEEETKAMNQATDSTVNQLQALQHQATPQFQATEAASTPQQAQANVTQGQNALLGSYARNMAANMTTANQPLASGSSGQVTDLGTSSEIQRGAAANAANAGYTNLGQQWSLQDQQARDVLGNLVAQGSTVASSLPAQLAIAKNSQSTLSGIGSLLGTAGKLASVANSSGAFSSASGGASGGLEDPGATDQYGNPIDYGSGTDPYNYGLGGNFSLQPTLTPFQQYNWAMPAQ